LAGATALRGGKKGSRKRKIENPQAHEHGGVKESSERVFVLQYGIKEEPVLQRGGERSATRGDYGSQKKRGDWAGIAMVAKEIFWGAPGCEKATSSKEHHQEEKKMM